MSKNILIMLPVVLKERTAIHSNVEDKHISPEIKTAQDMYIHPLLGTPLFNKIISLIDADATLATAGVYKTLVDDYILDAICNYTLMLLPEALSMQLWNKGAKSDDKAPSLSDLQKLSDRYKVKADFYAERLVTYLKKDNGQNYPEYTQAGNTQDDMIPERDGYSMPLWLGSDDYGSTDFEKYKDPTRCR